MDEGIIDVISMIIGMIIGMILITVLIVFVWDIPKCNYRKGQIDALTNKIEYHLVINEDSTRTWERIKQLNKE